MNKFSNVLTIFFLIVLAVLPFLSPIINILVSIKIVDKILPAEIIHLKGLITFSIVVILLQILLEFILSLIGYTSKEISRMAKENKLTMIALELSSAFFCVVISYVICLNFNIGNVVFSRTGLFAVAFIASFFNLIVTLFIARFLNE